MCKVSWPNMLLIITYRHKNYVLLSLNSLRLFVVVCKLVNVIFIFGMT